MAENDEIVDKSTKMFAEVITNSDLILQNLMTDSYDSVTAQHFRAEPAFEWNIKIDFNNQIYA